jgi:hypothetical protein
VTVQVLSRLRLCWICSGQNGTVAGFLLVLQFPLPIFIPPTAPYSLIISSLALKAFWNNRLKKTPSHFSFFPFLLQNMAFHICLIGHADLLWTLLPLNLHPGHHQVLSHAISLIYCLWQMCTDLLL